MSPISKRCSTNSRKDSRMKKMLLRKSWIPALLLVTVAFAMKEAGEADAPGRQAHLSGLTARITRPDGTVQMAKLEGLGCSQSICSRVAIKGKAGNSLVKIG